MKRVEESVVLDRPVCNHIVEFNSFVTHAYCEKDFCCDAESGTTIYYTDETATEAVNYVCKYCPECGVKLET